MSQNKPLLCEKICYQQVQDVVHTFYQKLINHAELGHFFEHIDDFDHHEKRICDFWWLSMGGKLESPPKINMIAKHMPLGIKQRHLQIWLTIFSETLSQQLDKETAKDWMDKALQIGARIKQIVIDHQAMGVTIKNNPLWRELSHTRKK